MKILGEELGKIGRWYIAVPPLLLIGFLVGLFFLAAAGQSRLNAANERVHASQLRQQALSEFIALIVENHWRVAEEPVEILYTDYSMSKGQPLVNGVNIIVDGLLRGRMHR